MACRFFAALIGAGAAAAGAAAIAVAAKAAPDVGTRPLVADVFRITEAEWRRAQSPQRIVYFTPRDVDRRFAALTDVELQRAIRVTEPSVHFSSA